VETLLKLIAVIVLVAANGFFVATEFALVGIRRSRVEQLMRDGIKAAHVVDRAVHDLDRYIAGTQVGITLASIALGWLGEPAVAEVIERPLLALGASEHVIHATAFAMAYAIITFLHVVFGELIPKSVALQRTESTALRVARPMALAMAVFRPIVWVLNGTGNAILRAMGLEPAAPHHSVHTPEELEILVAQSHAAGVLDDLERRMVQRAFRFSERTAQEVMVPRPDMVALDIAEPTDRLLDVTAQASHTRLPVYEDTIDNVIGILHMQDLFKRLRLSSGPIDIRGLLRSPLLVPESAHLDGLLEQFRLNKTQIAIVVDEHGGTSGLVTLEDVVEEVFGDLYDAVDVPSSGIERRDGRVLVRGDLRLDEVNEHVGWMLDDPDAATIGGFVMKRLGRIARVGDVVTVPDGIIRVEKVMRHRIIQVALTSSAPSS
jgi:putative hemolysin